MHGNSDIPKHNLHHSGWVKASSKLPQLWHSYSYWAKVATWPMTAFFHLHRQGTHGKLKSWFSTWWNNLNHFSAIIDWNLWLSHTFGCKKDQYVQESLLYQNRCEKAILDSQLLFGCLNPALLVCLWLWYKNPTPSQFTGSGSRISKVGISTQVSGTCNTVGHTSHDVSPGKKLETISKTFLPL